MLFTISIVSAGNNYSFKKRESPIYKIRQEVAGILEGKIEKVVFKNKIFLQIEESFSNEKIEPILTRGFLKYKPETWEFKTCRCPTSRYNNCK